LCFSISSFSLMALKNIRILYLGFLCFMLFNLSTAQAQSPENGEAADGQATVEPLLVGQKVPEEFWIKEHLFYVDGDTIRRNLEEYRGKLLVLDFWASWCAICLHHMKGDRDLWKKYQKNTSVLRVN